jgi:UDP-N-acetylglucosamine 2-epimerase (non-hydrolysing)
MAAALVAAKLEIPVGHIEAGLRSFDRTMPEEINRVVTDSVSDLLFIHSPEARDNLLREGRPERSIHYVGNTMIDTLVAMREAISATQAPARHGLDPGSYVVVTLHRPSLVDGPLLPAVAAHLRELAAQMPLVFPVHPRTRAALAAHGVEIPGTIDPVGYLEFLGLVASAAAVLTDSGGIQEETTYLGVPCFTLRDNTERPITIELGTNVLLGLRPEKIAELPQLMATAGSAAGAVPPLWDGAAGERVAEVLSSQSPIRRRSWT